MWPVEIVLLDPASDRRAGVFEAEIFVDPNFLLLQAAMKPFDVAVAFCDDMPCGGG